jgi:hypothetical protein
MSDQPIFFKPKVEQVLTGLDAIKAQLNLLLEIAIELGVDDEMEALIREVPRCRVEVLRHYLELSEGGHADTRTTLVDKKE